MYIDDHALVPEYATDIRLFAQGLAEAFRLGSTLAATDQKPDGHPDVNALLTLLRRTCSEAPH